MKDQTLRYSKSMEDFFIIIKKATALTHTLLFKMKKKIKLKKLFMKIKISNIKLTKN
jgi:hypothetical protein